MVDSTLGLGRSDSQSEMYNHESNQPHNANTSEVYNRASSRATSNDGHIIDEYELDETPIVVALPPIEEGPVSSRTLSRKLKGIHLFMISINGTFGTGLYGRSGQILELGGPLAVVLSYLAVGGLAWAVMQCITELLCIWPIPGALSIFVRKFVDDELGIAVGVSYWFTYSISFSALIASAASYLNYWTAGNATIAAVVVYITLPLLLVGFNTYDVEIYGWIEVFTGSVKLIFLAIIIITLVVVCQFSLKKKGIVVKPRKINFTLAPNMPADVADGWNNITEHTDTAAALSWPGALMMCFSIAAFSYVGIEIIAASAVEARWKTTPRSSPRKNGSSQLEGVLNARQQSNNPPDSQQHADENQKAISSTIVFTAVAVPLIIAVIYVIGGLLVSLNVAQTNCSLPKLSWVDYSNTKTANCKEQGPKAKSSTSSPFVIAARDSGVKSLGDVFNGFILFTVLACANTNLYVASRTLAGLTYNLRGEGRVSRWLYWFGKTNDRKVPLRAMVFSAIAFAWVPFLQLAKGGFDIGSEIGMFIEVLSQMGTNSVIIVWACECLAYIQYHRYVRKSTVRDALRQAGIRLRQDQAHGDGHYLYRSHWQPLIAYLALGACVFIQVICNGALFWKKWHFFPFLLAYLPFIVFGALWTCLKLFRGSSWSYVKLTPEKAVETIIHLNELREATIQREPQPAAAQASLWHRALWLSKFQKQG